MVNEKLASMIDHTQLKAQITKKEIINLCNEAKEYNFASVCVNPYWVSFVSEQLKGSSVKTCTVVGFPLGANISEVKAFETKKAIEEGATEIDMVLNIGALKSGEFNYIENDIKAVVKEAKGKAIVKVILETCLLEKEEKIKACEICVEAGADYVKTSTGFSTGGATIEDIELMRKAVGENFGVKASGGIKDKKTAIAMVNAGATRIGTSSGVKIISE